MKILLLEDDTALASVLVDYLEDENEVVQTYSMKKASSLCEVQKFDLYIFDINVPDGDGISLLKELREFHDNTPTIFITAFHDTKYLKAAFESGANDFIKKPFDLEELGQRISNVKRQFGLQSKINIEENIIFDIDTHIVQTPDKNYTMTHKESDFLHYLYKNRARVVSSDELLQNIWEFDEMPSDDAVRTVIKNLRKYIGKEHILNVRGEGYKYE
ncbi:response regulator transcription factor [Sulfurimonas sp. SAG-AH-194-C20]|nr:response regulator transcription factor [Sulfurimonas sp. SAG-AH-194-C20]MDF1878105.1 response regulator transcription factor [Sulfurimonas sp. SAG-AH-194-C20]